MNDLVLDRSTGAVTVTVVRAVRLPSPPAGVWARMVNMAAGLSWVDQFDGSVAAVTASVLTAAGHPPLGNPDRWPLWFHDPTPIRAMLEHWRTWPYSPFTGPQGDADSSGSSDVGSPGTRALAALYRACRGVLTPAEVSGLALWEIAALADRTQPADTGSAPRPGGHVREMRPDGRPSRLAWTRHPNMPLRYQHHPDRYSDTQPAQSRRGTR